MRNGVACKFTPNLDVFSHTILVYIYNATGKNRMDTMDKISAEFIEDESFDVEHIIYEDTERTMEAVAESERIAACEEDD
jgi:hypothetical protein